MQERIHYPIHTKNWTINTFSYLWNIEDDLNNLNPDVFVATSTVTQYNTLYNTLRSGGNLLGITDNDIKEVHTILIANKYVYEYYQEIKNTKEFKYPKVWNSTEFITQSYYSLLRHEGTTGNITVISIPWQMKGHRITPGSIVFRECFLRTYDVGWVPEIYDDGLGNLIIREVSEDAICGHIDYEQGLIVVWDLQWDYRTGVPEVSFTWSSDTEVRTFECLVDIKPNILWSSLNQTWRSNIENNLDENKNTPSGWDPFPHFTTIGLYNDQNELLMIAKLSSPIKRTNAIDQLVHITYDM